MKTIQSLLLIFLLPSVAMALDTWEPYPMGPSALEFYATVSGLGSDEDAFKGKSVVIGPAWGLHESTHLFLFTGISYPDAEPGSVDFLSIGLFRNFLGGVTGILKADGFIDMTAFGPGLGSSSINAGLEINYDADGVGLYGRPIWSWYQYRIDGPSERDLSLALGAWYEIGGFGQLFFELGYQEMEDELESASKALGLNMPLTEQVEFILEVRFPEQAGDEKRGTDITLGAVTVW